MPEQAFFIRDTQDFEAVSGSLSYLRPCALTKKLIFPYGLYYQESKAAPVKVWKGAPEACSARLIFCGPPILFFKEIVKITDWTFQYRPLDSLKIEQFARDYELELEEVLCELEIQPENYLKHLKSLKGVEPRLKELLETGKLDYRVLDYASKNGFRFHGFFYFCFEKGSFNYSRSVQIIENFGRYFRREKIDPEEYLQEHYERLSSLVTQTNQFFEYMRQVTEPVFYQALLKRKKQVQELQKQSRLGNLLKLSFDESLEEKEIQLHLSIEDVETLYKIRDRLQDAEFFQAFEKALEP